MNLNPFKWGKKNISDTRTEEQKEQFDNAKKISAQSDAFWVHAIRKGGTGYLRNQPKPKKEKKSKEGKNKVGKFANVKSRKERRAEVTKDTSFVPLYNGEAPYRGQNKDVLKIQKNEERSKDKLKAQ
jgi:hypothetical protein